MQSYIQTHNITTLVAANDVFSGVVGMIYHGMHQCIVKGRIRDHTWSKPTCAACARVLIQVCLMNGKECKHVGTIPTADYNALMATVYKM